MSAPHDNLNGSEDLREWLAEFEAAARRPLKTRFRYAFIHTHKPVLDDVKISLVRNDRQYRAWCQANLPDWLGYGPAV